MYEQEESEHRDTADHDFPYENDSGDAFGSVDADCNGGNNGADNADFNDKTEYLTELAKERDAVDPTHGATIRLLDKEIERVSKGENDGQSGTTTNKSIMLDIASTKPIKLVEKIRIPATDYPKINFVGRLLGPGGRTLKAIQTQFGCRMAILGKGSIRDKIKEQELIDSGDPKYAHLSEELHLSVSILAPTIEAYNRLCRVMEAISPYLRPEFDEKATEEGYYAPNSQQFQRGSYVQYPPIQGHPMSHPSAGFSKPGSSTNGHGRAPFSPPGARGRATSTRGSRGFGSPASSSRGRGRGGDNTHGSYSGGNADYRYKPY